MQDNKSIMNNQNPNFSRLIDNSVNFSAHRRINRTFS
jgi:hypothetical protein